MEWFRLYGEFATDPKVQMLSEADQRRFIMLLCLRCSNDDVTLHDDEIAFQLRISNDDWATTKATLIGKRLIHDDNTPTSWEKRQFVSDSSAERVARHRAKKKQACNVTVTPPDTDTDTEENTLVGTAVAVTDASPAPIEGKADNAAEPGAPPCPYDEIRAAYNEALPNLPQSREMSPKRQRHLQARWRDRWRAGKYVTQAEGIAYWRKFFGYAAASQFLNGSNSDWRPDFGWLIEPENFLKVLEGKYHDTTEHTA